MYTIGEVSIHAMIVPSFHLATPNLLRDTYIHTYMHTYIVRVYVRIIIDNNNNNNKTNSNSNGSMIMKNNNNNRAWSAHETEIFHNGRFGCWVKNENRAARFVHCLLEGVAFFVLIASVLALCALA